jgi:hypothetical protein
MSAATSISVASVFRNSRPGTNTAAVMRMIRGVRTYSQEMDTADVAIIGSAVSGEHVMAVAQARADNTLDTGFGVPLTRAKRAAQAKAMTARTSTAVRPFGHALDCSERAVIREAPKANPRAADTSVAMQRNTLRSFMM